MAASAFGERLAQLRNQKEISQYRLAELLGFSRGQIANYEQGTRQPDFDTLKKFADFFNVTTDFLLGRDSNPDIQSISTLGNRISELRKDKGLTQEELANVIHVNRATLANWEIDRATPDPSSLEVLADYFNISVDYLLGRADDPNAEAAAKIAAALQDNPELLSFWQDLSQREDLQLMFKQVRDFSPESIRKIVRIIKAIEDEEAE